MTQEDELVKVLEQLIPLLENEGYQSWATWMIKARRWMRLPNSDGVEKILSAYGGGSHPFEDVVLKEQADKNAYFSELRAKAFELASAIKQQQS
uniref:DUF6966 domain-containing protein n=1 Tax=Thaumasiovibrio occultus TaxID=1891184 RepID=UPI000B34F00A|nr:hypothetical protein [Thaumasiovibrio occultus]